MEIIRKGQLPEEKKYEGTCPECKALFHFKADEVKFQSNQRDGTWVECNCPFCKKKIQPQYKEIYAPTADDYYRK